MAKPEITLIEFEVSVYCCGIRPESWVRVSTGIFSPQFAGIEFVVETICWADTDRIRNCSTNQKSHAIHIDFVRARKGNASVAGTVAYKLVGGGAIHYRGRDGSSPRVGAADDGDVIGGGVGGVRSQGAIGAGHAIVLDDDPIAGSRGSS